MGVENTHPQSTYKDAEIKELKEAFQTAYIQIALFTNTDPLLEECTFFYKSRLQDKMY